MANLIDPLKESQGVKSRRNTATFFRDSKDSEQNPVKANAKLYPGERWASIFVPKEKGPFGKLPVNMAFCGLRFDVPRDTNCLIPERYYLILINAQKSEVSVEKNPYTGEERSEVNFVPSYPFQFRGWVEPDEEDINHNRPHFLEGTVEYEEWKKQQAAGENQAEPGQEDESDSKEEKRGPGRPKGS